MSSSASGSKAILIGKVSAAHGVRGELRITSFSGEIDNFKTLQSIIIKKPDGCMETFAVAAARANGKKIILSLKGYSNINEVLHLPGSEVYIRRDQLPPLPDDEYYWCDLLGLQAVTEEGKPLGELSDIITAGGNDVYVIKNNAGEEILVPAVDDVVLDVDISAGRMTVSLPEGLLDL